MLVQLGRRDEAAKDIGTLALAASKPGMLRMQLYLRKNGFPDIALDGERTPAFDDAIKACFLNQACARGLTQPS